MRDYAVEAQGACSRSISLDKKVIKMLTELKILLTYCLLIVLMLIVQSVLAVRQHGVKSLVGSRDGIEFSGIADRAIRAFNNTLISMVLIMPPVFTLALIAVSTTESVTALVVFVIARVFYFCTYLLGISWVRSCLWWVGLLCTIYLYLMCLDYF